MQNEEPGAQLGAGKGGAVVTAVHRLPAAAIAPNPQSNRAMQRTAVTRVTVPDCHNDHIYRRLARPCLICSPPPTGTCDSTSEEEGVYSL